MLNALPLCCIEKVLFKSDTVWMKKVIMSVTAKMHFKSVAFRGCRHLDLKSVLAITNAHSSKLE